MADLAIQNQQTFRELVQAFAYPGRKRTLEIEETYQGGLLPETIVSLFALLDGEVTYHILGEDKAAEQEIQFRTLAQTAAMEKADYIVVPLNQVAQIAAAIEQSKKGTLADPNLSATFIIECKNLQTEEGSLTWTGPGIKTTVSMAIADSETWLGTRNEAVSDFPLGIDVLFVGKDGSIVGLPRTTKVEGVE